MISILRKLLSKTTFVIAFVFLSACANLDSGNELLSAKGFVDDFFNNIYQRDVVISGDISRLQPYLAPELYNHLSSLRKAASRLDKEFDHQLLVENLYNVDFFYGAFISPKSFSLKTGDKGKLRVEVLMILHWEKGTVYPDFRTNVVILKRVGSTYQIENIVFDTHHRDATLKGMLEYRTKKLDEGAEQRRPRLY